MTDSGDRKLTNEEHDLLLELYPISIMQAPFGSPDLGLWIAIPNYFVHPSGMKGDSKQASSFWRSTRSQQIGWGETPNEALHDMLGRNSYKIEGSPFKGYTKPKRYSSAKFFLKRKLFR